MKEADAPATGPQGTAPVGSATPGGLLRQERERRGATIQQAAEDLHLDPKLVEAIEANRFEALGAPVYAKGHLRKYAMLLNLSPDVVVGRYEALMGMPEAPTPIPTAAPPPPRRVGRFRVPLIIIGVLFGVGLFGWIIFVLLAPPPPPKPVPPTSAPRETAQAPTPPREVATPLMPVPKLASSTTPPAAAPREAAPPAARAAPGAPSQAMAQTPSGEVLQLHLEFSEPSWIEVYDAGGERLVYGMGTPERARSVSGVGPLKVVLGLASAVTAEVNGRNVAIPRRAGRDGVQFEIGADGAVR